MKDELKKLSEEIFFDNEYGAITPQQQRNFYKELLNRVVTVDELQKIDLSGVQSDVIPTKTLSQDLGSPEKAWNKLHIGALQSPETVKDIKLESSLIPTGEWLSVGSEKDKLGAVFSTLVNGVNLTSEINSSRFLSGDGSYKEINSGWNRIQQVGTNEISLNLAWAVMGDTLVLQGTASISQGINPSLEIIGITGGYINRIDTSYNTLTTLVKTGTTIQYKEMYLSLENETINLNFPSLDATAGAVVYFSPLFIPLIADRRVEVQENIGVEYGKWNYAETETMNIRQRIAHPWSQKEFSDGTYGLRTYSESYIDKEEASRVKEEKSEWIYKVATDKSTATRTREIYKSWIFTDDVYEITNEVSETAYLSLDSLINWQYDKLYTEGYRYSVDKIFGYDFGDYIYPIGNTFAAIPAPAAMTFIMYDGEKYIACGLGGYILYSYNGLTWQTSPVRLLAPAVGVAYQDGTYVIATNYAVYTQTRRIYYCSDITTGNDIGYTDVNTNIPGYNLGKDITGIKWFSGTADFRCTLKDSTGGVTSIYLSSYNGADWEIINLSSLRNELNHYCLAEADSSYYANPAVLYGSTNGNATFYNGSSWNHVSLLSSGNINDVTSAGDTFYLINGGNIGTYAPVNRSPQYTYTDCYVNTSIHWNSLDVKDNILVAVGNNGYYYWRDLTTGESILETLGTNDFNSVQIVDRVRFIISSANSEMINITLPDDLKEDVISVSDGHYVYNISNDTMYSTRTYTFANETIQGENAVLPYTVYLKSDSSLSYSLPAGDAEISLGLSESSSYLNIYFNAFDHEGISDNTLIDPDNEGFYINSYNITGAMSIDENRWDYISIDKERKKLICHSYKDLITDTFSKSYSLKVELSNYKARNSDGKTLFELVGTKTFEVNQLPDGDQLILNPATIKFTREANTFNLKGDLTLVFTLDNWNICTNPCRVIKGSGDLILAAGASSFSAIRYYWKTPDLSPNANIKATYTSGYTNNVPVEYITRFNESGTMLYSAPENLNNVPNITSTAISFTGLHVKPGPLNSIVDFTKSYFSNGCGISLSCSVTTKCYATKHVQDKFSLKRMAAGSTIYYQEYNRSPIPVIEKEDSSTYFIGFVDNFIYIPTTTPNERLSSYIGQNVNTAKEDNITSYLENLSANWKIVSFDESCIIVENKTTGVSNGLLTGIETRPTLTILNTAKKDIKESLDLYVYQAQSTPASSFLYATSQKLPSFITSSSTADDLVTEI